MSPNIILPANLIKNIQKKIKKIILISCKTFEHPPNNTIILKIKTSSIFIRLLYFYSCKSKIDFRKFIFQITFYLNENFHYSQRSTGKNVQFLTFDIKSITRNIF